MDLGGPVQARRTAGVQHPDDGGWAPAPTSRHSIAWSLGTAVTAVIVVVYFTAMWLSTVLVLSMLRRQPA